MLFFSFNKWGLRRYLSEDIYGKNTLVECMAERDVCREHKKNSSSPILGLVRCINMLMWTFYFVCA